MKFFKYFLLAAVFIFLPSCKKIDLMVRFADTYIKNEVDNFLDLTSAQSKTAGPEVDQALRKVRHDQFPKIAAFLETVRADLAKDGATQQHAEAWMNQGHKFFNEFMAPFEPLVQDLSDTVSAKQEELFAKEFTSKLDELREKTSTPEKIFKLDSEKLQKWQDQLSIDLTREQQKIADEFMKENPNPYALQIRERESFLAQLKKLHGKERKEWLHKIFTDPDANRSPEAREAYAKRDLALEHFMVKIWPTFSAEQKKSLDEHLHDKAQDFKRLSQ